MKEILVVDDEAEIASICRDYLQQAGYTVITASNGADALQLARARRPDLIVLDLGLPDTDGLEVAHTLRERSNVPIIMLTARVDETDKVTGLELGADDYITKPFSPRELVARVRTIFRRVEHGTDRADVLRVADVKLDLPRQQVEVAGRAIELTGSEFQLLATMMRQPGRIFTRAQLLDAIRGEDSESFERAVDAHVKNLRRKIEPDGREPRYVLTVYGVGYKFAAP